MKINFFKFSVIYLICAALSQSLITSDCREAHDGEYEDARHDEKEYADVIGDGKSYSGSGKSGFLIGLNYSFSPSVAWNIANASSLSMQTLNAKSDLNLLVGYYWKNSWYFAIELPFILKSRNTIGNKKIEEKHLDLELHMGPTYGFISLNTIIGAGFGGITIDKSNPYMFSYIMGLELLIHIMFIDISLAWKKHFISFKNSDDIQDRMNYLGSDQVSIGVIVCF